MLTFPATSCRRLVRSTSALWALIAATALPAQPVVPTAAELWHGYDPTALPLDSEVVREVSVDGITLRTIRYTSEIVAGFAVRIVAYHGFRPGHGRMPAILHVHGGGQNANAEYVKLWASRGYAVLSINWGGRPLENRESNERTDWGPLPYAQNSTDQASVYRTDEPRKNSWYHWTIAARRGISFLAAQPEVDPERIGMYGISMGGRLAWLIAGTDARLRCAVSIYGATRMDEPVPGVDGSEFVPSLRGNTTWRAALDARAYAPMIRRPFLYLSATDDFYGRMDQTEKTLAEIPGPSVWRVYAPHFSHHVPDRYAVALEHWMAGWLQDRTPWPSPPTLRLSITRRVDAEVSVPASESVRQVDVLYSTGRFPQSRHWRTVPASAESGRWHATLPLTERGETLRAFANVTLASGLVLSTAVQEVSPEALASAGVEANDPRSTLIDDFSRGAEDWFVPEAGADVLIGRRNYFRDQPRGLAWNPEARSAWRYFTRKVGDPKWRGPDGAGLRVSLTTSSPNGVWVVAVANYESQPRPTRVYAARAAVSGRGDEVVSIALKDFREIYQDVPLADWREINLLGVVGKYRFSGGHMKLADREIGSEWQGPAPRLRRIEWIPGP